MADLLTLDELRVWTRRDIADGDPFALAVIGAASLAVLDECGDPDWTISTVPAKARAIAVQLAKRTYLNPDAIVAEGGIGPIGGDRFIEDFARTLELTEAEKEVLGRIEGVASASEGGLWVLPLELPDGNESGTIYVRDDGGSNWALPLLDVDRDPYYWPPLDEQNQPSAPVVGP